MLTVVRWAWAAESIRAALATAALGPVRGGWECAACRRHPLAAAHPTAAVVVEGHPPFAAASPEWATVPGAWFATVERARSGNLGCWPPGACPATGVAHFWCGWEEEWYWHFIHYICKKQRNKCIQNTLLSSLLFAGTKSLLFSFFEEGDCPQMPEWKKSMSCRYIGLMLMMGFQRIGSKTH